MYVPYEQVGEVRPDAVWDKIQTPRKSRVTTPSSLLKPGVDQWNMPTEAHADLNDDARVGVSDPFPASLPEKELEEPEQGPAASSAPAPAAALASPSHVTLHPVDHSSPTFPSQPVVSYSPPLHPLPGHSSRFQPRHGSRGGCFNTRQYLPYPYHQYPYSLQSSWHVHHPSSSMLTERTAQTASSGFSSYLHDRDLGWVASDPAPHFDPPGAPSVVKRLPPSGSRDTTAGFPSWESSDTHLTGSDAAVARTSKKRAAADGDPRGIKTLPVVGKEASTPEALGPISKGSDPGATRIDAAESGSHSGPECHQSDGAHSPSSLNPLRGQKNARARLRATQKKEYVEMLAHKDPDNVTEAERKEIEKWEKRRSSKNERSRERSMECKEEIAKILAKSPAERTRAEEDFLQVQLSRRTRKNEGDRLRRQRLRLLGIPSAYKDPGIKVTARGPIQLPHGDGFSADDDARIALDNDRVVSSHRSAATFPHSGHYVAPYYGRGPPMPYAFVPSFGPYGVPMGHNFGPPGPYHYSTREYQGFPPANPRQYQPVRPPTGRGPQHSPEGSESD